MKDRSKVKVCLKCKKLYEKCYCARPYKYLMGLYEIDKMINGNKII